MVKCLWKVMKDEALFKSGWKERKWGIWITRSSKSDTARAIRKQLVDEAISFFVRTTKLRTLPKIPKQTISGTSTWSQTYSTVFKNSGVIIGGGTGAIVMEVKLSPPLMLYGVNVDIVSTDHASWADRFAIPTQQLIMNLSFWVGLLEESQTDSWTPTKSFLLRDSHSSFWWNNNLRM